MVTDRHKTWILWDEPYSEISKFVEVSNVGTFQMMVSNLFYQNVYASWVNMVAIYTIFLSHYFLPDLEIFYQK